MRDVRRIGGGRGLCGGEGKIGDGVCPDDLKPGDCEMVVDWGRALQPCRYRLFTHMSCIILYPYSTYPCRGYTHVITNTGGNNY